MPASLPACLHVCLPACIRARARTHTHESATNIPRPPPTSRGERTVARSRVDTCRPCHKENLHQAATKMAQQVLGIRSIFQASIVVRARAHDVAAGGKRREQEERVGAGTSSSTQILNHSSNMMIVLDGWWRLGDEPLPQARQRSGRETRARVRRCKRRLRRRQRRAGRRLICLRRGARPWKRVCGSRGCTLLATRLLACNARAPHTETKLRTTPQAHREESNTAPTPFCRAVSAGQQVSMPRASDRK